MLICKIGASFDQPESQPDIARAELVASDPDLNAATLVQGVEDGLLCSIAYLELGCGCDQSFR
jgi:hypothetical protein